MKHQLHLIVFLILLGTGITSLRAQQLMELNKSQSIHLQQLNKNEFMALPRYELTPPNLQKLRYEDSIAEKNGMAYRMGTIQDVFWTPLNSGTWKTFDNGDRMWMIRIHSAGAQALTVFFDHFNMKGNSFVQVFDITRKKLSYKYDISSNLPTNVQNIPLCESEDIVVVMYEPAGVEASELSINQVAYVYRGISKFRSAGDSGNCQNDINCPKGNDWQDEKRGVARILLKNGSQYFFCTGSLVNNQNNDCKPYFLLAQHCDINPVQADLNQWKFNFNFEVTNCGDAPLESLAIPSNTITGCFSKAFSNDGGGVTGSDYLLVQLGSASNETTIINTLKNTINAYWNGWDANNTAITGGAGIHHPSGDVKKISFFTVTTTTSGWNGNGLSSHWKMKWSDGVTEGGSSGSPLFAYDGGNSHIIGTLTGGSSYCTQQQNGGPNSPDYYGKMSYHWDQNTTSGHIDLKVYLDPNNSGNKVCDGSYDPCAVSNMPPDAKFNSSQTTISTNTTIILVNTSTNNPTSNAWTITPTSGWNYSNGTNGSSYSPEVNFTQAGTYSVKLIASNSFGSDTANKINYIVVQPATSPCLATSNNCDEYIASVTLGNINNSTNCNNYTLYTNQATSLQRGQSYTIQLVPGVQGASGQFYTGDILAAWIDFNHDFTFSQGEQVYYETLSTTSPLTSTFNIPATSTLGQTVLRVRIDYQNMDPCGTSQDGEVEDYYVTIVDNGGVGVSLNNSLNDLMIYPNPSSDHIYFKTDDYKGDYSVKMVDLTGRLILNEVTDHLNGFNLNIKGLNSGVYQIMVKLGDEIRNLKFIKK